MSLDFEELRNVWRSSTPIDAHEEVQRLAERALKRARREKLTNSLLLVVVALLVTAAVVRNPSPSSIAGGALFIAIGAYYTWWRIALSRSIVHWDPHLFHRSVSDLAAASEAHLRFHILVERGMPLFMIMVWLWRIDLLSRKRSSGMVETALSEGLPMTLAFAAGAAFAFMLARRARRSAAAELAQIRRVAAEYERYAPPASPEEGPADD